MHTIVDMHVEMALQFGVELCVCSSGAEDAGYPHPECSQFSHDASLVREKVWRMMCLQCRVPQSPYCLAIGRIPCFLWESKRKPQSINAGVPIPYTSVVATSDVC